MHGRLKVRSTAEQEELKRQERKKKLEIYKHLSAKCIDHVKNKDFVEAGLKQSEDLVAANPDILTLWNLRRNIFLKLENEDRTKEDLNKLYQHELNLTELALRKNPKSYGAWFHRQWLLLNAQKLTLDMLKWDQELGLCNKYLSFDERNFHCWAYRQFVVEHGQISKMDELEYTYESLCSNFSNYSAWHYRSKLINDLLSEGKLTVEQFKTELDLIENAVFTDPNDQSAWIYEKWLLLEHLNSNLSSINFSANENSGFRIEICFVNDMDLSGNLKYFKLNNLLLEDRKWAKSENIWVCDINGNLGDAESIQASAQIKVEFCLRNLGVLSFILERISENQFEFKSKNEKKNLKLDNELLNKHFENLLDLSKLENNKSKWCSLTLIELMSHKDYQKYRNEIDTLLDKLANEIDLNRRNFYLDLKQKLAKQFS